MFSSLHPLRFGFSLYIPGPATASADDKHHTSTRRKPTPHAPPLHSLSLRFYEEYTSPALPPSRALRPHSQHRWQKPIHHDELDPTGGECAGCE